MEKSAGAEKAGIENEAADTKNFVFDHSSGASQLNFPWLHERRSGGIGMKDACELAR
jgi:hypothetical protein